MNVPPRVTDLATDYHWRSTTASDINEHLPTFVDLVQVLNAQHVIELGTRSGVSTVGWLHGLTATGGHLTSIDLSPRPDLDHYEGWTFIQGDDLDEAIVSALEPAEIVFVDTSHTYEQTVAELERYRHLVKPGGVIVLHDTENRIPLDAPRRPLFPVKRAIKEFAEANGLDWFNYPNNYGLGIIRMKG
jgi:cephalosporin hydroxylase